MSSDEGGVGNDSSRVRRARSSRGVLPLGDTSRSVARGRRTAAFRARPAAGLEASLRADFFGALFERAFLADFERAARLGRLTERRAEAALRAPFTFFPPPVVFRFAIAPVLSQP
jgi:hypothetical protein